MTGDANPADTSLPVVESTHAATGPIRPSRMERRRALVLIAVHVVIVVHVIQYMTVGRTISPVEPSESMQTLETGLINAGFVFFALALLSTVFLGRFICGWACHVVALQDLCGWIMRKLGVKPRPFRSRLLVFVPLGAALYMFVWPSFYRLVWGTSESAFPGFTWQLTTTDFWRTFPGVAVAVPFLFVCGFAAVYFLGAKGYCTYACPYGGFFGLADRFSPGSIRVTDACNSCGHCTATCTSNVRVHAEVRDFGMVVDPGCMKCLDCVSVCPNDALYFGFGRPSLAARPRTEKPAPRRYDLSWGEELLVAAVFVGSLLAVRGVYNVVPFLMALGVAAITSFVVLNGLHLFRRADVRIQNLQLKSAGRWRPAGGAFALFGSALLLVVLHSGVIQYNRFAGGRYYAKTGVPEELVLGGDLPADRINGGLRDAAAKGRRHLEVCDRWGVLDTADVQTQLAWFALLEGRRDNAVDYLARAASMSPDNWRLHYYLGSVQSSFGRFDDAIESLRRALSANPACAEARFRLGNALAATGDLSTAISEWSALLETNPDFPAARHNLACALRENGQLHDAVGQHELALQQDPDDAASHFEFGVTLSRMGQVDRASIHFSRAVTLDPYYQRFVE